MAVKTIQPEVPFWDKLYALPMDDKSIKQITRTIVLDSYTNSATRTNPNQTKALFEIKKRENYLHMHEAGLRWRGKVLNKTTRAAIAVESYNDMLGVIGCMISRARLTLSGKEIELVTDVFMKNSFTGHLENRLTDPVARDLHGYFPETDTTEPYGRLGGEGYNGATVLNSVNDVYIQKLNRRNGKPTKYPTATLQVEDQSPSAEIELFIPLKSIFGFFRDNLTPIFSNEVKIEVDLVENNVIKGFTQTASGTANGEDDCLLQTTFLQLEFDEVFPSDEKLAELLALATQDPIMYRMWRRYECEAFGGLQTAGAGSINVQLGSYTSRPDRIYVAVQSQQKANKLNQIFNYSTFDKINYKSVHLKINGSTVYPTQSWEYDISNRMVTQLYDEYVKAQAMYSNEDSGLMPINVWLENYFILCFDIRHLGDSVFKGNTNTSIYFQASWDATPVVHPYATMVGQAVTIHASNVLPAEAQGYQFIKCVEIPCSATIDVSSGSMLFNNIVN